MEIADRDLKLILIKKAIKDNNDFEIRRLTTEQINQITAMSSSEAIKETEDEMENEKH